MKPLSHVGRWPVSLHLRPLVECQPVSPHLLPAPGLPSLSHLKQKERKIAGPYLVRRGEAAHPCPVPMPQLDPWSPLTGHPAPQGLGWLKVEGQDLHAGGWA